MAAPASLLCWLLPGGVPLRMSRIRPISRDAQFEEPWRVCDVKLRDDDDEEEDDDKQRDPDEDEDSDEDEEDSGYSVLSYPFFLQVENEARRIHKGS